LVGNLSLWFTLRPDHRYLQLISAFCIGLGVQGCWLMVSSMVADSCDEDEVVTGLRREGVYSAVSSFCMKVSTAIGTAVSGYLVAWSGYRPGASISSHPVPQMNWLLVGTECTALAAASLLFWFYPLTRTRVLANQRILAERNRPVLHS
jgi:GPH family glycoside/pentoside/hexuronide:cation symporter